MLKSLSLVLILPVSTPALAEEVTVAWDAYTEPDLAGYKIYVGKASRFNTAIDYIKKWCDENEPTNLKCAEEWLAICKEDKNCHAMLFGYDRAIDVGNVTEYTVTGLAEGSTYFFAASAYDDDNNESSYSIELTHTFPFKTPGEIRGAKRNKKT